MADISSITLPNGSTYTIKDETARSGLANKVAIGQGIENAGKFLVVGSDGNVAPISMSVWQGGSY